jgi:hypothetical protein
LKGFLVYGKIFETRIHLLKKESWQVKKNSWQLAIEIKRVGSLQLAVGN